ncbi:MAG: GNAT family N-acetyltransferase [Microterricola sp.]
MTDRPPGGVPLRAVAPDDTELLKQLFAESRGAELAALPDDDVRALFLSMQWAAQSAQYERVHPVAESQVILAAAPDGAEMPVGRLLAQWMPDRVHIVDIAVLAAHQGRGHGTAALTALLRRADAEDMPVTLSLLRQNSAAHRLYSRLGFVDAAGSPEAPYLTMRRARHSERSA